MKAYIQLICMALIVVINYSCDKKIPVIEHSISGVLYLDHTLQPAANYEVRLQYNSQAYSLRDTKILDECITDENGNFYLKYVKIAGAGELEIENSGGTALLTEIPVNEDINFSFPIQPYTKIDFHFNYNRPLDVDDTVFVYAGNILNSNSLVSVIYLDLIKKNFIMLTSNFQPALFSAIGYNSNSFDFNVNYEQLNDSENCFPRPIGYGFENIVKNDSVISAVRGYIENIEDSSLHYYCMPPKYTGIFSQEITIDINLPN